MDDEKLRHLPLEKHFSNLARDSKNKLYFEVLDARFIGSLLGSDIKSRNHIYRFKLNDDNQEVNFVAYSLVLNGQTRSNTRAEAFGRALAAANGKLFEENPFLLVFDYVGNQIMAVSAAKLFGAFTKKSKIEPRLPSRTATFTLSPHFGNVTISMYATLEKPDVWWTPLSENHPTFGEVREHLLRFKDETASATDRIQEIVETLKARISAKEVPPEPIETAAARISALEPTDRAPVGRIDITQVDTGVESERSVSEDDDLEKIAEPFDPENIDVITRSMTVDLLLSRTESQMIDLQPDFQRRWGIWDNRRQSRLIESLLLRIPLPVLYAAEDDDERWEIVDGIQRLSAIARFIRPTVIQSEPLELSNLEYLKSYDGKKFMDLSQRMQMRLRETELVIHLIRKGTPPEVKYNIFARINTGGVPLSPQELRHAITPGRARIVLQDWAKSDVFKRATDGSVQPIRMDDRELVLRFIAFYSLGLPAYRQPDMDGFLVNAMKAINGFSEEQIVETQSAFYRALNTAYAVFGNDAFRKRFGPENSRLPINKALFEAVSVNLANLDQSQVVRLIERKERLHEGIIRLCNDRAFESSISQGTGDVRKVKRRFTRVSEMITTALRDD